jgi:hypothetical protein
MEGYAKRVEELERTIHDHMDKPHEGASGHLLSELRALRSDFQTGKNLYSIEDRIKRIVHILEGEAKNERIMNYEHLDLFKRTFEHMREAVRDMQ